MSEYQWGERVIASPRAVKKGLLGPAQEGIVLHAEGLRLWIVREGYRTVETYHRDFWQRRDAP